MKTASGDTALELQWVCPQCKHRVGYIPIIHIPIDAAFHPWEYLRCPVCEKADLTADSLRSVIYPTP